jgi:phosphoglycolate phosphatase-like HAD superfamily hydrolase
MALLVLFDVDGTLLLSGDRIAGRALRETLEESFAVELPDNPVPRVDHPGQTCQRIARLLLRDAGLADERIDEGLQPWCAEFAARYVELLARGSIDGWEMAVNATQALARLTESGVTLALLTGNPEPMARARMERLGLARFFPPGQGGFGCDGEERRQLIELARERAGGWPAEDTVAVGDTARDVESAHASGIRAIVLRSAAHPEAELHADAAFDDLDRVATQLLAWAG